MALRHSFLALSRRASPLLTSSIRPSPSTPRAAIAHAFQPTPTTQPSPSRQQTRLSSSSIPGLLPPWQFSDLSAAERRAFERHGPSYLSHTPAELCEVWAQSRVKREQMAAELEAQYGANWYAIMKEATRIKDEAEKGPELRMLQQTRGLRQKEQKEKRFEFYNEVKRTKQARMKEALKIAAQRLGGAQAGRG